MDPAPRDTSLVGRTISHYKVLRVLGKGGMGIVYEAEDLRLGRRVALKCLPDDHRTWEGMERFHREGRAASALNHPNICTIYDVGNYGGRPFIVMERMHGQTLRELMDAGRLTLERTLETGAQLANALDAAHHAGIVHRDLKPANIFITEGGHAKLLDFGLAKRTEHLSPDSDTPVKRENSELTNPGLPMGTVLYMSPEQARGLELDGRSDLFSLGVVLYEAATGLRPFSGRTNAEVFNGILSLTPTPPSQAIPGIPAGFDAIVARALQKDASKRYPTAADLEKDLVRLMRQSVIGISAATEALSGPASTAPAPGWKRVGAVVGGLTVLAALALGIRGWRSEEPAATRASVLVGDTANRTGEPAFDQTVDELFATSLEQSRFLSIYPRARVGHVLQLMKKPADSIIDETVGLEICQREGLDALATSSVSRLGETYVLLVSIEDTGARLVASARETFREPAELPARVDAAVAALRKDLGESAASIREHSAPLADVTSGSLEAVKFYTTGRKRLSAADAAGAIVMFEKALELDPSFAMAHEYIGIAYENQGSLIKAQEHVAKAVALVDHVGEAERHKILADHNMLLRNWAEACPHLEVLAQLRPLDPTSFLSLGVCKSFRYDYEGAIAETRRSIDIQATLSARGNLARLEVLNGDVLEALERANALRREMPASLSAQLVAGVSELVLGRLDDATKTYRTLVTLGGDAEVEGRLGLGDIALAQGEAKQARAELEAAFLAAIRQGNDLAGGRAAVTLAEIALASSDLKEFALQMRRVRDRSNPLLRFLVDRTRLRASRFSDISEPPLDVSSSPAAADRSLGAILRAEEAMARKDWPKAIQEADQAWSLDPSVLARETQARARTSSNPKEAAAFFEDVLRRGAERILAAPDSPGFHRLIEVELELGILLDNLGEKQRSRPHLEAFLAVRSVSGLSSKAAVDVTKRLQVP